MKKLILILLTSILMTGCAEYLQHVKDSSSLNQTSSIDGQEKMHRILPHEFTLNGHIQPNGQYGGGLGGGF